MSDNPVDGAVAAGIGAALGIGGVNAVDTATGGGFGTVIDTLAFPGTWKRIGLGALGVYVAYLGIVLILSQTTAVKNVLGTALGAATKGVVKA